MVVICGQVPTAAIGTDAFQEAPVAAIMGSVAKHIFLVTDPARLEATMRTAFEIARTGRPGPVVVDVPKDVQNWSGVYQGKGALAIPGYRRRLAAVDSNRLDAQHSARFFELLGNADFSVGHLPQLLNRIRPKKPLSVEVDQMRGRIG